MPATVRPPLRLLRILLNAATVLSLVLCAATVGLWVRSYGAVQGVTRTHVADGRTLVTDRAQVGRRRVLLSRERVHWEWGLWAAATLPIGELARQATATRFATKPVGRADDLPPRWGAAPVPRWVPPGVSWGAEVLPTNYPTDSFWVAVPCWAVALAAALLPGLRVATAATAHRRRSTRRGAGLCPACGYDLPRDTGAVPGVRAGGRRRVMRAPLRRPAPGTGRKEAPSLRVGESERLGGAGGRTTGRP
jgi:hypothetical protein